MELATTDIIWLIFETYMKDFSDLFLERATVKFNDMCYKKIQGDGGARGFKFIYGL